MDELKKRAEIILSKLNTQDAKLQIRELEAESMDSDFWNDNRAASAKMQELARLQKEVENAEEISLLLEMNDAGDLEKKLAALEFYLYLSGPHDKNNVLMTIQAGQGGSDAMDWASMLYRMYTRFFERRGWKYEEIDFTAGDEAGIKKVVIEVQGEFAYGYMRGEQGVHRLVRLSPFNANQLRQTSFALVEVLPEIENDIDIAIKEDDLEWNFYRASSHGGQNVQKVSSAVRLKHIPTGIVVTCQTERYQNQNREYALKMLKAKLWAKKMEERSAEEKKLKGEYKAPSWGNQIRSYVLHPYKQVKDLRTGVESNNPDKVLDGELDVFIDAELKTSA